MTDQHTPHNIDELKHELEHHDEWFRHAPGEVHQQSHGDFNPIVIMAFLAITIIIVFGSSVLIVTWFGRSIQSRSVDVREQNTRVANEYQQAMEEWNGALRGGPRWLNQDEGTVMIPIDMAMDEVVRRYAESGGGQ